MQNRKKILETCIYSLAGIACMAVLLVGVNIISRRAYTRLDLTTDKVFTLTKGTREILAGIDQNQPLTLRFYFRRDLAQTPAYLKAYAQRIEDLLKEYEQAAAGRIQIEILDPSPDSDAEEAAQLDNIYGEALDSGEKIYCGLAIALLDRTATLAYLSPEREHLLEYDITRAIYRLLNPKKPVVGVISSLPVMGTKPQMMMMMQQQQPEPPWILISELQRDFEVRGLEPDPEQIAPDVDILLLVYANALTSRGLFAIDQFVLRGGKLLAFLDAHSLVGKGFNPMGNMNFDRDFSASLDNLMEAWGVKFDTSRVAADALYKTTVGGNDGRPLDSPVIMSLDAKALDKTDPAAGELNSLLMGYAGTFSGTPAEGLTRSVLLATTENAQLVDKQLAEDDPAAVMRNFKAGGSRLELAIRLSGSFRTAFPDGAPPAKEEDKSADSAKPAAPPSGETLKTSAKPSAVVLIGDADMVYDQFCARQQRLFGQTIFVPFNDNLTLIQNLVEHLSGDSNLISIRSRGTTARPFTRVAAMEAAATAKFQEQLQTLEKDLEDVKARLNDLQQGKKDEMRMVFSKEQLAEVENFRKREAETNKKLKEVRKELRREIDALEIRLKWLNIALIPLLVGIGGIVLAICRSRRSARK